MPLFIPLPLVIIAGGKSSRMGHDKALLPFGSFATLTQYQLNKMGPHFSSLHVSTKTKDKFAFEASFIEDDTAYEERSPLIAIVSILKQLNTPFCALSVDTPFVGPEIFATLYNSLSPEKEAIVAHSPQGIHPLCAIYTPSLIPAIETMLQQSEHKIQRLLERACSLIVDFEDDKTFLNLNYPEEYEKAKGML